MKQSEQDDTSAYEMAYMLEYTYDETARERRHKPPTTWPIYWNILIIEQSKTTKATYNMACMLEYIDNETARARRHKPPTQWTICWNILIMKQPEQGDTSRI